MANHYRIIFDVWSVNPEPLHTFLGTFISGGWYAHVPVPDRQMKTNPLSDSHAHGIDPEVRAWGAYLFPDIRILTNHGLIDVCEPGRNLPQFAAESIDKRIAQTDPDGEHPGFIAPKPTEHMASIIAESRAGIPWKFFQTVIDKYYDAGLRFFVVVYDHVDASYGSAAGHLFYSVSSDFACDNDPLDGRSIHCIGLTVPEYVTSADPREMLDGDGGDDLDLPRIDTEGNEVPEHSAGSALDSGNGELQL
jgi:hypothetical protein